MVSEYQSLCAVWGANIRGKIGSPPDSDAVLRSNLAPPQTRANSVGYYVGCQPDIHSLYSIN
jgi:hypothetical protein